MVLSGLLSQLNMLWAYTPRGIATYLSQQVKLNQIWENSLKGNT